MESKKDILEEIDINMAVEQVPIIPTIVQFLICLPMEVGYSLLNLHLTEFCLYVAITVNTGNIKLL